MQSSTHLLLILSHVISLLVNSVLHLPKALLQLGLLFLLSFLYLLLEAGDHLRRPPHTQGSVSLRDTILYSCCVGMCSEDLASIPRGWRERLTA